MIGVGERSGSGIPKVLADWEDDGWETPKYEESNNPDRTLLTLPIGSTSTSNLVESLVENFVEKVTI